MLPRTWCGAESRIAVLHCAALRICSCAQVREHEGTCRARETSFCCHSRANSCSYLCPIKVNLKSPYACRQVCMHTHMCVRARASKRAQRADLARAVRLNTMLSGHVVRYRSRSCTPQPATYQHFRCHYRRLSSSLSLSLSSSSSTFIVYHSAVINHHPSFIISSSLRLSHPHNPADAPSDPKSSSGSKLPSALMSCQNILTFDV